MGLLRTLVRRAGLDDRPAFEANRAALREIEVRPSGARAASCGQDAAALAAGFPTETNLNSPLPLSFNLLTFACAGFGCLIARAPKLGARGWSGGTRRGSRATRRRYRPRPSKRETFVA